MAKKVSEPNTDITYIKTDNLLKDAQIIIETAQKAVYSAVNITLVKLNWLLGRRIAEEEFKGKKRAEYGAEVIKKLSYDLTKIYGTGFDPSNLYKFVEFYETFSDIFHLANRKSSNKKLDTVSLISTNRNLDTVSLKSIPLLTWTNYRILLQVKDPEARNWYALKAADQIWDVRTLQRNISSQYY